MEFSQIPSLVPLPFAANGTKNAIPTASQIGVKAGAASLNDGFPPLTFTPLAAGGVPPSGADFNGILNLLSANTQWSNAGGFYEYSSSFSSAIGGYPKLALLAKASGQGYWLNLEDNNSNDPDTGGAGWLSFDPWAIQSASYFTAKDTGTANAYAVTLTPAPSALTPGMLVNILQIANTNTGASTLAVNGLSTLPILLGKGTALTGGELTAGYGALLRLNNAGTAWELVWTGVGTFVPPATQNNAAVQLAQVLAVAPQYNRQTYTPASGDTYTISNTFTAPCNGFILAASTINIGSAQPVNCTNTVSINGTNYGTDTTPTSMTNWGAAAVSSGTACTVTSTFTAGSSAGTFAPTSQTVMSIFIPNP